MKNQVSRRRTYLVDPTLQYWLMGRIAIMAAVTVAMSLLILAAAYHLYGGVTVKLTQPDPFGPSGGQMVATSYHSVFSLFWPIFAVCLLVTLFINFVFGLFISHHLAGPAFRMRRTLLQLAEGDLSMERMRLREKDMFEPMAQAVNELSEHLRGPIQEMQRLCLELTPDHNDGGQQQRLDRLREILSKFKTL